MVLAPPCAAARFRTIRGSARDAVARLAGPRAELIAAGDGECALDALELAMPGTDSNIVLEMLELINEEKCFEQLERADDEARELLEMNWPAVERLATSLVEEEELPGERVAELLLGLGIHQGRIPVRLELPVGENSSAEEPRRALEELELSAAGSIIRRISGGWTITSSSCAAGSLGKQDLPALNSRVMGTVDAREKPHTEPAHRKDCLNTRSLNSLLYFQLPLVGA